MDNSDSESGSDSESDSDGDSASDNDNGRRMGDSTTKKEAFDKRMELKKIAPKGTFGAAVSLLDVDDSQ